jgi:hypothetical protein
MAVDIPDEEIGGHDGMAKWVESSHFKNLNIGFALVIIISLLHKICCNL